MDRQSADDGFDTLYGRVRVMQHEAPGEHWTYRFVEPPPELARDVYMYWEVNGVLAHVREKVMPTGDVVVIFNLGPAQALVDRHDETHETIFRNAFISGLQEQFLITASHEASWMCGVRLTPLGAYRILRLPMREVANTVIDFDAVMGPAAHLMLERLRNAGSPAARFMLLDRFLAERLRRAREPSTEIVWAWDRLIASRGSARILDLARDIGWSRKHLRERFLDQVGLAPKAVGRLLRFHGALREIGQSSRVELARVAAACGYADQAHFNRDFRAFAGDTPETYLKARVPDSEFGFMVLD